MLAQSRAFFAERDILEVDCPALNLAACIDTHIEVMEVQFHENQIGYLHTSPEYGMKQLLSLQIGDIYQLSHVFRKGEIGPLHEPEFTMVEWYRCGFTFEAMIEETLEYIRLFLGKKKSQLLTYREAFLRYVGVDYVSATPKQLLHCITEHGLTLSTEKELWDKDTLLQCLMSFVVEPHLPREELVVLYHYPATQAALAQTRSCNNEEIAERFEIYAQGVELANGYHELTDADEQKRRFEWTNRKRQDLGKNPLPLDEKFLSALKSGLPDCCGVAVGFDRLMLLKHQKNELGEIMQTSKFLC